MDTARRIKSVSLLIYTGVYYEGIRLFDDQGNTIVDEKWNEREMGQWSEPQIISEDKYLIGVQANTVNDNYITSLSFILSTFQG